jgi:phospholipid/cholesterol/gamma-HCH transport system ATP-binding protein
LVAKIALENVHKAFGPKKVLQGINLSVAAGQSLVIIGGSGTGKSVMIKIMLGLMPADSGLIRYDGQPLERRRAFDHFRKKTGMLFQGAALFDSLPVWENVAFGLMQAFGIKKREARQIAVEKLAAVGLGKDVADLYPAELSGGMQKRVGLARAIAAKPEVIFFDEPTTGLDPIRADVINNLIVQCVRDLGATAFTITHDMASVRKIADTVAMLYEGKIIWNGSARELDRCDNAYVQQFVQGLAKGPIDVLTR